MTKRRVRTGISGWRYGPCAGVFQASFVTLLCSHGIALVVALPAARQIEAINSFVYDHNVIVYS